MVAPMKAGIFVAVLLGLAALVSDASAQAGGGNGPPVVVELYTSQGCVQCPRANRLLEVMSHRPNVLALTFSVGIWDYLGWRDTLARPEYAQRQRAYSSRLRVRGRFTPQLVFNGVNQVSAGDWDTAQSVLDDVVAAARPQGAPEVSMVRLPNNRVRVTIGAGATGGAAADIWLIAYDPGPVTVLITGGVNMNRTIQHFNLVRTLERVDGWDGASKWFERQHCDPECAVLIQAPNGGPILAAAYTYRPERY
jgi:hypothetical protein